MLNVSAIGAELRKAVNEAAAMRGMSVKELCAAASVSEHTVCSWRRCSPNLTTLALLCDYPGFDLTELITARIAERVDSDGTGD